MVKGLTVFREHFAGFEDQYVLIGGTAATLAMEEAGLDFRATKDLDILLHLEALTPEFGQTFWAFIERGGYETRQASETGKPQLYRFQKPTTPDFPAMLELFCRSPDRIRLTEDAHLTPIPFDEVVASLSAILLDNEYYEFIFKGRRINDAVPWIGAEQLIPLKARAWLDMNERKAAGEPIDSKHIRKHANDIIRLAQLLSPTIQINMGPRIAADLDQFLTDLAAEGTLQPKDIQIKLTLADVIERIRQAYGLRR